MWEDIKAKNWEAVESKIADGFQSVHPDGPRDRVAEIALLKKMNLGDFTLSNFKSTIVGDNIGFAIGHYGGRRLIVRYGARIGITESRRLVGEYVLRREDMDQPMDDAIGITGHWTRYGARYWIPYRSLLVRELDNLLAAGRCISVDHRTHHATKEIPACMVTGQAAGTAAALAVQAGIGPKQVDLRALRDALRQAGAIL